MSPFKLLNMEYVPLHKVYNLMNPIDVFMLSQSSTRSRKIIPAHRSAPSHCNFYMSRVYDEKNAVEIVFSEFSKLTFVIDVRRNRGQTHHYENEMIPAGKIDDQITFLYSHLCINTIFYYTMDNVTNFRKIAEYVLSIFPCPLKSLHYTLHFYRDLDLFTSWNFLKNCDNFILNAANYTRPTAQKLERLINFVDFKKSFELFNYAKETFDISKITNLDEVHFGTALCLTEDQCLSLNCKRIHLRRVRCCTSFVPLAIQRWLRKEHEALEQMTVFLDGLQDANVTYNEIIEGLPLVPWDPTKRARYFRKHAFQIYDCSTAMDIYRDDGKIASFIYTVNFFHMFVWHQPMQNVSLARGTYCLHWPTQPIVHVLELTPRVYKSLRELQIDDPVEFS